MTYGIGFNSLTGAIRGYPLIRRNPEPIEHAGGQTVRYYLNKVESVEELKTQLGLSVEVDAQFGLFGASAKFEFAKSSAFNSYSVFLVARVEVTNAFQQLIDPAFDEPALELLRKADGYEQFRDQFGDSFIFGMQTGGEFCAVLELLTTSQSDQQSLSASLQGSYGAFGAETSFTQSMRRATENRFLKVSMYQAGGVGTQVTSSVEEVLAKVRTFAAEVQAQAVPYTAKIIDYTTLDAPLVSWIDRETARTVLIQYAGHRDHLLALLSDIDYVRNNLGQFVNPDIEALNAAAASIAERLDKLTENARTAVEDPKHAKYVDVGQPKFTIPARNPSAPIKVVSLVGLRLYTVRTVMENPKRPYREYLKWCDENYESGTVAVKPSPEQYEFLISGIRIEAEGPFGPLSPDAMGFMFWVFKQDPDRGTVQLADPVKLTGKSNNHVPEELKHLWGL
ncbi:hypothetical protein [Streptomyces sp. NPDC018711]|uniref:hypothetical protein n=1 Tax=Streptomyces sp. NPDC018711 TaxID=3365052 RepID=UPI0037A50226